MPRMACDCAMPTTPGPQTIAPQAKAQPIAALRIQTLSTLRPPRSVNGRLRPYNVALYCRLRHGFGGGALPPTPAVPLHHHVACGRLTEQTADDENHQAGRQPDVDGLIGEDVA